MPDLSQGAYIAWELAAREAARAMHPYIDKEFLLIGLCSLEKWLAAQTQSRESTAEGAEDLQVQADALQQILRTVAITPTRLRHTLRAALGKGTHTHEKKVVHRSEACRTVFQRAGALAEAAGAAEISCLHLLLAIFEQPGGVILGITTALKMDIEALRTTVSAAIARAGNTSRTSALPPISQRLSTHQLHMQPATTTPYLDRYGSDITREAREGNLEPIVGRKDEILALVRTLSQHTKNTPVLVSEPGVSRIAVVKGLALRIARGDVVAPFRDKRIIELHMGGLAGVTTLHGEFAQALQHVLTEADQHTDVVLFIDEMHAVVGAGSLAGNLEIAQTLKAALLRGHLRCIGATTIDNYQRYIASDPQLERLCQPLLVHEPSLAEMKEILAQVRGRYERHHGVIITPEAIEMVVELAAKHLPEKRFPEKALDLIDQACSRAHIVQLTQLAPADSAAEDREVTRETIAEVVAEKTGIPLTRLTESERDKLRRRIEELKIKIASN